MIPYQYALRRRVLGGEKEVVVTISGSGNYGSNIYATVKLNGETLSTGKYTLKRGTILTLTITGNSSPYIKVDGTIVRDSKGSYDFIVRNDSVFVLSYNIFGSNGYIDVTTNAVELDIRGTLNTARATVTVGETQITVATSTTISKGTPVTLAVSGNNATSKPYSQIIIDGETVATGDSTYIYTPTRDCTITASRLDVPNVSGTNRYGVIEVVTTS